jgi:hypothetical protein
MSFGHKKSRFTPIKGGMSTRQVIVLHSERSPCQSAVVAMFPKRTPAWVADCFSSSKTTRAGGGGTRVVRRSRRSAMNRKNRRIRIRMGHFWAAAAWLQLGLGILFEAVEQQQSNDDNVLLVR